MKDCDISDNVVAVTLAVEEIRLRQKEAIVLALDKEKASLVPSPSPSWEIT
jgi:hypothetical protein